MKILIFFGSARKQGNTYELLKAFLAGICLSDQPLTEPISEIGAAVTRIAAEHSAADIKVEIIDAYRTENVHPCIDCKYCWRQPGCSIKDAVQPIYEKIEAADIIVFATPVYFYSIPGPLKCVIDRMQTYWAQRIRRDKPKHYSKIGVILLTGGAPPFPNQFLGAELVLEGVMEDLNVTPAGKVTAGRTDKKPVADNEEALTKARSLAEALVKSSPA